MKCVVDMDGVLVDFHSAWEKHHNVVANWDKGYSLTEATNIKEVDCWNNIDDEWWANLPWTDDGEEILKIIEKWFRSQDICLVSRSPWYDGTHHIGPSGKVKWIAKHIPRYLDSFMIGTHRHWMANRHSILIDDSSENCGRFIENGGQSILIPRPWNHLGNQYINVGAYLEYYLSILVRK